MWKYLAIAFGLLVCVFAHSTQPLVVSYVTTALNGNSGTVIGVLVTPGGQVLQTSSMGPYSHTTLVVNTPVVGNYQAYFQVVQLGSYPLCPFVGGVGAFIDPTAPLATNPLGSRIQAFPFGQPIQMGSTSQPVCTFEITSQDLL